MTKSVTLTKEELDFVNKYRLDNRNSSTGFMTDIFGNKINVSYHSHLATHSGKVLELDEVSDQVLHESLEYYAVALGIDQASRDNFIAMELGAGYGPWVARSGVLAKRKGIKDITLIAVEADKEKYQWLNQNLVDNGLVSENGITINKDLYNSAVSATETELYFPVLDNSSADYGARASKDKESNDYRGMNLKTEKVPAIPLNKILEKYNQIDILFVDIQGAEEAVLESATKLLNRKVKLLAIGTHNRQIEGNLFELFFKNKWELVKESPCDFKYDLGKPSLTGMTIGDGFQLWSNPEL